MEKEAFLDLAISQERTLYRVAKTILRSDADCADAVQETLLKAIQGLNRLRNEEYVKTWLVRILINTSKDMRLSFSLTVGDAASRYAVPCPAPSNPQKGVTVRFTDLHFSPVTVSVDLEVDVSPEAMPFLDGPLDDEKLDDIAAAYFPAYYFFNFHLENSRGEALGPFREGMIRLIAREGGGITFLIHQEFAPSDRYTDTVYLVREDERLAIPLNPVNR